MLVSLSTLLRGTTYEKLKWTFTLYDLNKDGYITKQEVLNVMVAVHELMGLHASPLVSLYEDCWVTGILRRKVVTADGTSIFWTQKLQLCTNKSSHPNQTFSHGQCTFVMLLTC